MYQQQFEALSKIGKTFFRSCRIALTIFTIILVTNYPMVLVHADSNSLQPLKWKFRSFGRGIKIPTPINGRATRLFAYPPSIRAFTFVSSNESIVVVRSAPQPIPIGWLGPIELWSTKHLALRKSFGRLSVDLFENSLPLVALSPNGHTAAILYTNNRLCIWDTQSQKKRKEIVLKEGGGIAPGAVSFLSEDRLLISGNGANNIVLYEWKKNQIRVQAIRRGEFDSVTFSPKGNFICVTTTKNGTIYFSSKYSKKAVLRGKVDYASGATFSPDETLLCGRYDNSIAVWRSLSGEIVRKIKCSAPGELFAISPDNKFLTNAEGSTIKVWDLRTGKFLGVLNHGREDITALSFSRNGKVLLSGSLEGTGRLWIIPKDL